MARISGSPGCCPYRNTTSTVVISVLASPNHAQNCSSHLAKLDNLLINIEHRLASYLAAVDHEQDDSTPQEKFRKGKTWRHTLRRTKLSFT
jgi:hypothetical protein